MSMMLQCIKLCGEIIYFDTILCSTFKNNKYLEKGLMTGISGIVRASAFSGLNNVSPGLILICVLSEI